MNKSLLRVLSTVWMQISTESDWTYLCVFQSCKFLLPNLRRKYLLYSFQYGRLSLVGTETFVRCLERVTHLNQKGRCFLYPLAVIMWLSLSPCCPPSSLGRALVSNVCSRSNKRTFPPLRHVNLTILTFSGIFRLTPLPTL